MLATLKPKSKAFHSQSLLLMLQPSSSQPANLKRSYQNLPNMKKTMRFSHKCDKKRVNKSILKTARASLWSTLLLLSLLQVTNEEERKRRGEVAGAARVSPRRPRGFPPLDVDGMGWDVMVGWANGMRWVGGWGGGWVETGGGWVDIGTKGDGGG